METLGTTFVASLVGGGLGVALLNWWRTSKSETKRRQIQFLDTQIRELYGPLYFLASQSERLIELNCKMQKAYKVEYIEPNFSNSDNTKKVLDEETEKTLDISNEYIENVTTNNQKMQDIVNSHSSLMDPSDIDVFLLFFEHKTRHDIEFRANGELETPMRIYQHLGDVSLLRPEVIDMIKTQFKSKKSKLEYLLKL